MMNYNGYDFTEDIRVLEISRSLLPPINLVYENIAGRHGAYLHHKQFKEADISVSIALIEKNPQLFREKARDIADKLDFDEPKRLIFSDEPDKYINAILEGDTSINELAYVGKCSLNFLCPDPFWYAIEDDVYSYNMSGTYSFYRKGTADSYPLIEIKGTNVQGNALTISNSSMSMSYTGTLDITQTLVIDSDLMTAYLLNEDGSKTPAMHLLNNLDFLVLNKGKNTVRISEESGSAISKIKISCRSRWK